MTLSAFIVRTCTLTPGRRYSTASNLVMYVSAADNDYAGVRFCRRCAATATARRR